MGLPATIQPVMRKLLALLGSDSQGEVLAAVSAMRRVLTGSGFDFNDLAAFICPEAMAPRVANGTNGDHWEDNLNFCVWHIDRLNERERTFVQSLTEWRGTPTEKQLAWLASIAAKLDRPTASA